MPRFAPCAICGGPTGERPRFDPDAGGVACEGCAPRVPHALPVARGGGGGAGAAAGGRAHPAGAGGARQGRELLNVFIAHHLGRRLKSVDFMDQVGTD